MKKPVLAFVAATALLGGCATPAYVSPVEAAEAPKPPKKEKDVLEPVSTSSLPKAEDVTEADSTSVFARLREHQKATAAAFSVLVASVLTPAPGSGARAFGLQHRLRSRPCLAIGYSGAWRDAAEK